MLRSAETIPHMKMLKYSGTPSGVLPLPLFHQFHPPKPFYFCTTVKPLIVATHHVTLSPVVSSGTGTSHHMRSQMFLLAKFVTSEKITQIKLNMSAFQYFKGLVTIATTLNPFLAPSLAPTNYFKVRNIRHDINNDHFHSILSFCNAFISKLGRQCFLSFLSR